MCLNYKLSNIVVYVNITYFISVFMHFYSFSSSAIVRCILSVSICMQVILLASIVLWIWRTKKMTNKIEKCHFLRLFWPLNPYKMNKFCSSLYLWWLIFNISPFLADFSSVPTTGYKFFWSENDHFTKLVMKCFWFMESMQLLQ